MMIAVASIPALPSLMIRRGWEPVYERFGFGYDDFNACTISIMS
jgi:hypothetical protein